jgi:chemotaxis protein CheD
VQIVVGISDARVSADGADELITHALGSCIGVSLFDPKVGMGGMLHYQLPSSTADRERAAERPLMFADTGVAALIASMEQRGAQKRRMQVRLAGAARMLNDVAMFDIGRRNHASIRKIFWGLGMFIDAEQIGGVKPRTMVLSIATGAVTVRCEREIIIL